MNEPLVSIVTPTFCHEAYIGECIESVRSQNYANFEMCIVDDGSTDRTVEIAESYADPRILVLKQENRGIDHLAETYNLALSRGKGELVAILEGDDFWPPDKLQRQVPDFEDPIVALSSGRTRFVFDDGLPWDLTHTEDFSERARTNRPIGSAVVELLDVSHATYTFPVSTILRRSALESVGGFYQPKGLPLVDLPTFLRIATVGEFRFHDEVCGFWRRHLSSTTRSRLPRILDEVHQHAEDFFEEFGPKIDVAEADVAWLDDQWSSFQAQRYAVLGRMLLAKGEKRKAEIAFHRSGTFGGPFKRRLKSKLGLFTCMTGLPTEWVYPLMGLPKWKDEIQLAAGDQVVDESMLETEALPHDLVAAWRKNRKSEKPGNSS